STTEPKTITFHDFRYFRPEMEPDYMKEFPFLESVISGLTSEMGREDVRYRIAIGTTEPLRAPTRPFDCKLLVEGGSYESTGYAFRLSSQNKRTLQEAIPAVYPSKHSVVFEVPASNRGDKLLVVVLLIAKEESQFPENLQPASKLVLEQ